jgi:hypothetical protein
VALAVSLVSAFAFHSCKVYDSSLLDGEGAGKPVPKDKWGSGVGWWSSEKNGCITAGVPTQAGRPASTGGTDIPPFFMAVKDMALGSLDRNGNPTEDAWKELGFDLDGKCTASPTCPTSTDVAGCSATVPSEDGTYCRDNTFGKLEAQAIAVEGLGKNFGLSNDGFNCALCRGDYNFLIRITGWNGQPNDNNVRLDLYPSPGLETQDATWVCDLNSAVGAWKTNPCWARGAKFTVQEGSFDGTIQTGSPLPDANINDPAGYVREGYLIAQLPEDANFWFPGKSAALAYPLKIQRGIIATKLVDNGDGTYSATDGTIAGRAKKADLLSGFADLGLCEGNELWNLANLSINVSQDVLANGTNSVEATCDAMALGIGFTAEAADFSGTTRTAEALPGCPTGTGGTGGSAGSGGGGTGGGSGGTGGGTGGTGGSAGSSSGGSSGADSGT